MNVLRLYIALALQIIFSMTALAQRGEKTLTTQILPNKPSTGVPGFFDTNLAQKGALSFEFPTFALDYGITDRLTIGTNGIPLINTLISASSSTTLSSGGFYLKARYQLFAVHDWSSTLTGYLFNINNFKTDVGTTAAVRQLGSSLNISKMYDDHHAGFSFALFQSRLTEEGEQSVEQAQSSINGNIISIWWRYLLHESVESELLASFCPSPRVSGRQPTGLIDISLGSCYGDSKVSPLLRGLISWRSSESWLWTVGIAAMPYGIIPRLPYFGFNYLLQTHGKK